MKPEISGEPEEAQTGRHGKPMTARDWSQIMASMRGIEPAGVYPEHPRALRTVSVVRFEGEDYQFHSKVQTYRLGAGATPLAWVDGDRVCGAEVRIGKGRLRVFGARWIALAPVS